MTFDLPETLDILTRTPAVVDALLRGTSGRVMAKRYTEEVGVWRAYLSILNR